MSVRVMLARTKLLSVTYTTYNVFHLHLLPLALGPIVLCPMSTSRGPPHPNAPNVLHPHCAQGPRLNLIIIIVVYSRLAPKDKEKVWY